jgi:formamidopyrimidine-DNA glycosylase
MPELPEVETVKNGLTPIIGKRITEVTLRRKNLRFPFPEAFALTVTDARVSTLTRRAKYILAQLENNRTILLHLGMSGKILLHKAMPNEWQKHDHVIFHFEDGSVLVFNDARRFGVMDLLPTDGSLHPLLSHLGPEPLCEAFTGAFLHTALQKKQAPIKHALMDQKLVVGVGNIYAAEALFLARIHPKKKASTLSKKQCDLLVSAIKKILSDAIASGGSTLRDYVRSSGDMGYFQHQFQVYGRENKPCVQCHSALKKITQQGRSTVFCPSCQTY